MKTSDFQFDGRGAVRLAGRLDLPDTPTEVYALFAHCFTCGKSLAIVRNISRMLTDEGIGLLRFDFTGLGESEGEFASTTFASNIGDLVAAAEALEREYAAPSILIGHSLGGAAVLAAADQLSSIKCVATIGAPAEPAHIRHLLAGAEFDTQDRAEISIGGRPFTIGRQLLDDLESHDAATIVHQLGRPLLICHSPVDAIVGIDNAERLYKAARHPKSFLSLGQADHLVSRPQDARFLGHVLAAWAGYYGGA